MIPFVQRDGGSGAWHNYLVRMYLDHPLPVFLGNAHYGYFKELAVFDDPGTATPLKVLPMGLETFRWTFTSSTPAVPHSAAITTVENYQDALEILSMPILGTFTDLGDLYSCAYWEWDMQDATVTHIDVNYQFTKPFRVTGMASWVSAGTLNSENKGAFEMLGVNWRLAYPPIACQF